MNDIYSQNMSTLKAFLINVDGFFFILNHSSSL